MQIIIGADIVPTKSNVELFKTGDIDSLIGKELKNILQHADYRIFNLETPLTDKVTPIQKCGDTLSAPIQSINALKLLDIDLVSLSNNHIMDQGVQGLKSTIRTLDNAKIAHVGAGNTLLEAAQPFVFYCNGKKIGVYSCTEHEFSVVNDQEPGANPIDLIDCFDHINLLKQNCDYVIVLYHGGKEHYRFPSPNLQRVCRKFITKGADLVVCQHSHCIGAEEKYQHGIIVYGQGNFIFDGSTSSYWQTSMLIRIGDGFKIDYLPLVKENNGVRLADQKTKEKILSEFYSRNMDVINPQIIKSRYYDFAYEYLSEFLCVASGKKYNIIVRAINKLIGNNRVIKSNLRKRYTIKKRLTLLNRIECEANYELFIAGLKTSINREKKNVTR